MKKIYQLVLSLSISTLALADGNVPSPNPPDKVKSECASCHMVYQPAFLPKESWARIVNRLDKHYGVDASIDPQSNKEISQWLNQYASTYQKTSIAPPNDRITESAWFIKKHRELSSKVWANPKVKSRANCMACHTTADAGNYDEDFARIPK